MPRLRRKTPHEPVRAIPAPAERGPGALPRAPKPAPLDAAFDLRSRSTAVRLGRRTFDTELAGVRGACAAGACRAVSRARRRVAKGEPSCSCFALAPSCSRRSCARSRKPSRAPRRRRFPTRRPAMLGIFALRDRTLPMYVARARARPSDDEHGRDDARDASVRHADRARRRCGRRRVRRAARRRSPGADARYRTGWCSASCGAVHELVTLLDADVVVAACLADDTARLVMTASPPRVADRHVPSRRRAVRRRHLLGRAGASLHGADARA